jgi:hypothetical protein
MGARAFQEEEGEDMALTVPNPESEDVGAEP